MTRGKAAERIEKLRDQINDYRYQYHVLDHSTMSEAAADSLKYELSQLEQQFPDLITPDSPTQRVAGTVSPKFKSVPHAAPMLSLNDVFDESEVTAWVARLEKLLRHPVDEFFAEIKKDGLAASVIYENGLMTQGVTRGDGRVGEDVTPNIRTVETVPLRLRQISEGQLEAHAGRFEVRGEVVMYKDDFEALNKERSAANKPLFANPRNTAAGTIRQLDPRLVAERKLRFMVYLIETSMPKLKTLSAEQAAAKALGFLVERHGKVVHGVGGIMEFIKEWEEKRTTLPFGTDGIVITVNSNADFARLGIVGKAPRGAIAFKYPAEQATTKVKDIQVSIGRTGAATPFAVLEPVKVAGSTVGMATLHNAGEVARKDIRIGDTVIIQKAGDIIPEVVESLPKLRMGKEQVFEMPKNCPVCSEPLYKEEKDAVWRCINFDCPALEAGRITHFASKSAYDIEGLGEKIVYQLLDAKLLKDAADIFSLKTEDLVQLERFGQKSADNLVKAIQDKKNIAFDRFIYALGIRHVGLQTAADLAAHFGSLENFRRAGLDELQQVPGIGSVVAQSVYDWLNSQRHQEYLQKLRDAGVNPRAVKKVDGPLSDKNFVITGTLSAMSREAVGERIATLGGKLQNTVTKDTAYVVVGDDPGANKIKQAEKYGIEQIDEDQLLKLL